MATSAAKKAKPARTPKAKVARKSAVAKATEGRSIYGEDMKIKLLVEDNPKRKGSESHRRFDKYKTGQTVAEALKAGVTRGDLIWDVNHDFISIK